MGGWDRERERERTGGDENIAIETIAKWQRYKHKI